MSTSVRFDTGKTFEALNSCHNFPKLQEIRKPLMKTRARLTAASVLEIFKSKGKGLSATKIGIRYGINEKTVRDIWTGRTWLKETARLDPSRSIYFQKVGGPIGIIGIKDRKPRKKPADPEQCLASEVKASDHDLSLDEQLHEWNLQGCWVESQGPSFYLFLDYLGSDS